ncbi:ankyrin repeat and SOCS box protein 4 [Platysternon megacephalum]|uniref:Ankyrin repeat and SOCS box protein 4 n=1 Tax=Platysternon megacephalum TaxID=55544 RepID=A0A4D9EI22_9SAUR|nr:ankyrin repeat and SOCS box protein 4 [Platysternon megacephalum]
MTDENKSGKCLELNAIMQTDMHKVCKILLSTHFSIRCANTCFESSTTLFCNSRSGFIMYGAICLAFLQYVCFVYIKFLFNDVLMSYIPLRSLQRSIKQYLRELYYLS